ncbi:MAG: T9SS type A sorting domain-containing protein [Elusimicrobia bacterium]|nr:T9SS type A sorting domain-containing protein [Elusimicrobiota bacterium]
MIRKMILSAALAAAVFPGAAHPAWERMRSSDAPLAVIRASTGSYEINYTVGEACAANSPSQNGPDSVLSGYLSLIPFNLPNLGFFGFDSTNGVTMEGALWGAKPDDNIKLLFSTELSSTLSQPGLVVTQLMDNTGRELNESWTAPIAKYSVDYAAEKLIIVPSPSWPKGSVFSVYYSSYIVDINGYPVSVGTTVYFTVRMDYQADNTAAVLTERKAKVTVPANAYSGDFYLTLSTAAGGAEIKDANSRLAALPGSPEFLGVLNVKSYDSAGNPAQPGLACVIAIPYKDDNPSDGRVDGTIGRIKASGLSIWYLDETRKLWARQAGPSVDSVSKLVGQSVTHFSNFALLGLPDTDLTTAYAFPVPFRPNVNAPDRYGSWATGITFTNLPIYGTIKIYTLSGELARSMDIASSQSNSQVPWNVKNSAGEVVSSGVYVWEIVSGKNRKTGKLIVIK